MRNWVIEGERITVIYMRKQDELNANIVAGYGVLPESSRLTLAIQAPLTISVHTVVNYKVTSVIFAF